jgi:hypothetical protein
VPSTWCHDGDADGSGTPEGSVLACEPPDADWITKCDDCDDGNAAVHPGAECSPTSYVPTGGSLLSFDYDCDGREDECGTFPKAAASCGVVGPLNCAGGGYLPNASRAGKTDLNPYCGSTAYRNCQSVGLPCVAQEATKPPVTCR